LFERGAEIVVRLAERRFERHREPLVRQRKHIAPPGEF
jgi:hypothetical protein